MTEAEFKKHIEAAENNPKQLAAAVLGLSAENLRHKPAQDKWCILEILGHLADVEIMFGHRIRQILAEEKPVIAPMDQNAWARNLGYMETPPAEMIALFGINRHHNLRVLRRTKPEDLSKSAYHPELKRDVPLSEIVEKLDTHTENHLRQIEKLKRDSK
ncbi:MAG: DinB family protein [Terriglobales bacterium]